MTTAWLRASLALWRRRHTLYQKRLDRAHKVNSKKGIAQWHAALANAGIMVRKRERQLAKKKPNTHLLWMPGATHIDRAGAGSMVTGYPPRHVWHTTEGTGVATSTLDANGSHPHFEVTRDGRVIQYLPINVAAKALKHTQPTHTNRANCYQTEVDGRAASPDWPDAQVRACRRIVQFLQNNAGVPLHAASFMHPVRMSNDAWAFFSGHCGHVHVPQNDHTDPGHINIDKILRG